MRSPRSLAFAPCLFALGCAARAPAPTVAPTAAPALPPTVVSSATAAPGAPAPSAAPAAAPSEDSLRYHGSVAQFEVPWPRADAPGLRLGVLTSVPGFEHDATGVGWSTGPGTEHVSNDVAITGGLRVLRVSMLDATGDGIEDAVLWVDPASLPREQVPHSTIVLSYAGPERGPVVARWTSLALGVVADEAALRAAVPTLRTFVLPEHAPSIDAVMLRLGFATTEQFRTLVAPRGLTLCNPAEGNARPHHQRCRTYAAAAITDAMFAERFRGTITVFESNRDPDDATLTEGITRCRTVRDAVACDVPTGGPAGTSVLFSGPPHARRISRVETTVDEDGGALTAR